MTPEEKQKAIEELQQVRYEIDIIYSAAFAGFVEAVHNLSLVLTPLIKQQEALAYRLIEVENKLRKEVE